MAAPGTAELTLLILLPILHIAPAPTGLERFEKRLSYERTAMNRLRSVVLTATVATLAACGTLTGAAVGAGIGSTLGEAGKGAAIGAGVGAIYDSTH